MHPTSPHPLRAFGCALLASVAAAFAAPPTITQQPGVAVVTSGSPATFSVGATASGSLSYQWRHLGTPIANATGPTLTLSNVTMADAGLYDVVVTAGGESTTSQAGRLITTPTQYADQFCLDDSFLPLIETTGASAETVAADPITGGFYVGGEFSTIDGARRWNLARFDSAGNIDATFTPRVDGKVLTIAVQPDGKVLIGGAFRFVNNVQRGGIARLNTDGSLDRTFGNNRGFSDTVTCIGLQSTGRIIALSTGAFDDTDTHRPTHFVRLLPNGVLDDTFSVNASATSSTNRFCVDPQDRILFQPFSGYGSFGRMLPDGAKDTSFSAPTDLESIFSFAVQSDGRPIIALRSTVIRLQNDGSRDPSYNVPIGRGVYYLNPSRVAVDAKDRAIAYFGGELARILPSGTKDVSFSASTFPALAIAPLPSGQVATVGTDWGGLWLFNSTGTSVGSASSDFYIPSRTIVSVIPDKADSWLIAGDFCRVGGLPRNGIARIGATGAVDPQFTPPSSGTPIVAIVRQGDGKVLLSRKTGGVAVERLLGDGTVDPSFNTNYPERWYNSPSALSIQADGKVYSGGDRWIVRFNPNGTLDTSFAPTAGSYPQEVHCVYLQNDGKALVGGTTPTGVGGTHEPYLRRLLADGTADSSFSPTADFTNTVRAILQEPDGTSVAGGDFGFYGSREANCMAWLNPDGSFLRGGDWNTLGARLVSSLLWQADGRVIVSGLLWEDYGLVRHSLLRINADGTKDLSFTVANVEESTISGVCYDDAGRLLYSGAIASRCGLVQSGFARLKPGIAPEPQILKSPNPVTYAHPGAKIALQVQASGTGVHFRWFKNGVALPNSDSAELFLTAAKTDDTARYHAEATNALGSVLSKGADLVVTTEDFVDFFAWANAQGLTGRDGYMEADPEGDGMTNMLHYAFNIPRGYGGSNPTTVRQVSDADGDFLAIQFSRKTYATDIRYVIDGSSDLQNWQVIASIVPADPAQVTVKDTIPISSTSRRFLRVRIERIYP